MQEASIADMMPASCPVRHLLKVSVWVVGDSGNRGKVELNPTVTERTKESGDS